VADASEAHRARVSELGLAEHVTGDIAEAVKDADLVVIATPVLSTPEVVAALAPHMKPGATLTDVGSTKANVGEAFRAQGEALSKVFVIPGATRSPAPSSRAPTPASPSCSRTAGPS